MSAETSGRGDPEGWSACQNERMKTVPVDLILYHLRDLLLESPEPAHHDLAAHLLRAIDFPALAGEWLENNADAHDIFLVLDGQHVTDGVRGSPAHVQVARRLADVALSMLVTRADDRDAAVVLFDAAQRIADLAARPVSTGAVVKNLRRGDIVTLQAEVTSIESGEKYWPIRLKLPSGIQVNQAPESLTIITAAP